VLDVVGTNILTVDQRHGATAIRLRDRAGSAAISMKWFTLDFPVPGKGRRRAR